MKTCKTCEVTKDEEAFGAGRGSCRACLAAAAREYYRRNRDAVLRRQRKTRRTPEGAAAWRRYKYGLTSSLFEAMLRAQGGACAIAHPPQGELVVDHDHRGGEVRGLLCGSCNCGLGLLRDDPTLCERAAEYLERCRADPR
jgi:hypothetical protein